MKSADIPDTSSICCLELSPFEYADGLAAFSCITNGYHGQDSHKIVLSKVYPRREGDDVIEVLKEYQQERAVTCMSWSPRTNTDSLPYNLMLYTGSIDGRVSLVTTDLNDSNEIMELGQHRKSVNAIAVDQKAGVLLASVGDDAKCITWDLQTNEKHAEVPLTSAGCDVQFHSHDNTKIVVAERVGTIRFYDAATLTAFMSLDTHISSLASISWCSDDIVRLFALAGHELLVFDTSVSRSPVGQVSLPQKYKSSISGNLVSVCPANSSLVAVSCEGATSVRIYLVTADDSKVIEEFSSFPSVVFSWHATLPVLFCASKGKLTAVSCESVI